MLSPELLPAIVGVNLSRSAQILADAGVLVRRLDALENLGSMDVLCTDKTGTLTEGVVRVSGAFDPRGAQSDAVMLLAALNATLQAGLPNRMDATLLAACSVDRTAHEKLAEIPYDFVIRRGIEEGRRTFANTLKYVLTTTSANLGNMISMAAASLVLPFLPLTAGQVLLNNFLSDVPAVGIAGDRVDPELVAAPRRWDMRFIGRFMLEFGLLSSAFDALTFVVLILGFGANVTEFRTVWFVESLFTELVIALVVRTRRRAWRSRPGSVLVWTTAAVAMLAFALPYLPVAAVLGFAAPHALMMLAVVAITAGYVIASELMKSWFYRAPPLGVALGVGVADRTTSADREAAVA